MPVSEDDIKPPLKHSHYKPKFSCEVEFMTTAVDTLWEEIFRVRAAINQLLGSRKTVRILEVGCGDRIYIKTQAAAYRVGIDISAKQLERNSGVQEKILGDIQTYNFSSIDADQKFDLVVFWWVVEHLSNPTLAIQNCQNALKEDGIIVIATANIFSLKGLLTKLTPHQFHTWVYRRIFHQKNAGTNDHPPFETFLKYAIAPSQIKRFAAENHLTIAYFSMFEDPKQKQARENFKVVGWVWHALKLLTKILSLGILDAELTDYVLVLKRQQASYSPVVAANPVYANSTSYR
jgi:2-polyprenyl-3-methyl-5-hydroxy-6-metoxy-1,4-benzoquinol methylase